MTGTLCKWHIVSNSKGEALYTATKKADRLGGKFRSGPSLV